LNILFTFRIFEQLALALKNRVALKIFAVLKYFLLFRILSNLRLSWKQNLPWNFSLEWNIIYHSGILSNLRLPCKQNLPWARRYPPCTPMGLWYRGWKHYILYCLENGNFKTAWI